jgi:hypothetical protein
MSSLSSAGRIPPMHAGAVRTAMMLWLCMAAARAEEPAGVSATPLPERSLTLSGVDGSRHDFADLLGPDGKAVCFAFLHPACPLAQEYAPVLGTFATEFAADRIRFVGVVCECDDPAEIAAYSREYGIPFPIHLDTDFKLAEALDATVTPEVVATAGGRTIAASRRHRLPNRPPVVAGMARG